MKWLQHSTPLSLVVANWHSARIPCCNKTKKIPWRMGIVRRIETNVEIKAPADKFHEVYALKPYLISTISPQTIKSCELHEGKWGQQGCIVRWHYEEDGVLAFAKECLEEIDNGNFSSVFKQLEGGSLNLYKSMKVIAKATPKDDNKGSLVHLALEFETPNVNDVPDPHGVLQVLVTITKDISAYLTLVSKVETDVEISASADKFHEVYALKPHLISVMSPQTIKSCELHEGEWGKPGSVLCWNYEEDGVPAYTKELLEEIDDANFTSVLRVVEGGSLKWFKSFKIFAKATPKDKGSVVHLAIEYEKLNDKIPDPHGVLQFLVTMTKDISNNLTLVGKIETRVEIKAPAHKFHEAYAVKPHLISTMSPQTIKSCELHEGEWGKKGSVLCWNYEQDGVPASVKELLEEIDDENFTSILKVVEGGSLKWFKSFKIFAQATPKGEGSVVHLAIEYEKLSDDIPDPHGVLQFLVTMTNDISDYVTKA